MGTYDTVGGHAASPRDDVPAPSKLQEAVLALIDGKLPEAVCDLIMMTIERAERDIAEGKAAPGLPVAYPDEVTAAQVERIDNMVAAEFAGGRWETVESEQSADASTEGSRES